MNQERYKKLLDLFDRKSSLEKGMDSFDIVMDIENMVYNFLEDIFHPYEVTRPPPESRMAPDGIIKMGENLILFEISTGELDEFRMRRIIELIEYAKNQVLPLTYVQQLYTILVICRGYSDSGIKTLNKYLDEMVRKPHGVPILTPEILVKLHEMCIRNFKTKNLALTNILEETGPVLLSKIEEIFTVAEQKEPLLGAPTGPLRATLEYGQSKTQFEGNFDDVWRSINRFLSEIRPSHIEIALSKLIWKENIEKIVEGLEGVLKIAKDGPYLIISKEKLTSKEILGIFLLGAYIGFKLGLTKEDTLSVNELCTFTGLKKSVVQVQLSNMASDRLIEVVDTGRRRITTIGVEHFQNEVLPKLKARLER